MNINKLAWRVLSVFLILLFVVCLLVNTIWFCFRQARITPQFDEVTYFLTPVVAGGLTFRIFWWTFKQHRRRTENSWRTWAVILAVAFVVTVIFTLIHDAMFLLPDFVSRFGLAELGRYPRFLNGWWGDWSMGLGFIAYTILFRLYPFVLSTFGVTAFLLHRFNLPTDREGEGEA